MWSITGLLYLQIPTENHHRPDSGGRNGARSRWKTLAKTLRYHPFVTSAHVWTFSNPTTYLPTIVLFIPYSCLLVFGILVISVAWFSFHFFRLALQNVNKDYPIFLYFHNFIAKIDQKPYTKNRTNETNMYLHTADSKLK